MEFASRERTVYNVLYDQRECRWKVAKDGQEIALAWIDTDQVEKPKAAAIKVAVGFARKELRAGRFSMVRIHTVDGRIQSERAYRPDLKSKEG